MRPFKTQCTFHHRIVKIIASLFCIFMTPTHRLKMTTTNPAFGLCRFLVLVFRFSPRKVGVCPEKVGIIAFFGCSEFMYTKFPFILLLELKRYWSKVRVFWHAVIVGFPMVGLKNCVASDKGCWVRFCSKVVSAVRLSGKPFFFLKKCLFSTWHVWCY